MSESLDKTETFRLMAPERLPIVPEVQDKNVKKWMLDITDYVRRLQSRTGQTINNFYQEIINPSGGGASTLTGGSIEIVRFHGHYKGTNDLVDQLLDNSRNWSLKPFAFCLRAATTLARIADTWRTFDNGLMSAGGDAGPSGGETYYGGIEVYNVSASLSAPIIDENGVLRYTINNTSGGSLEFYWMLEMIFFMPPSSTDGDYVHCGNGW